MTAQHAVTTDAVAGQRQVLRISELRSHPARMLVVFGAPTALLITGLLHVVAAGDHNLYTAVGDQAPVWIGVHTVQLLLILLMAVAIYWFTEGLTGAAAQSSRVALLFYLVFYSAFDSVVGLSNGLVAQYGSGLTAAEQAVLPGVSDALSGGGLDQPVPFAIALIASASWLVAVTAAAVALHRAGAPQSATIPLGLAGVIGAVDHALPFGTIAMVLFLAAVYVLSRPRTTR